MSYWGVVPTYRLMRQAFRDLDDALTMYGHPHHDQYLGEALRAQQEGTKDFKVAVNLHGFSPEEISVKINERTLSVGAHHESETEHGGRVLKSYKQEYLVPTDVDLGGLKSSLNADGTLTITAPKRQAAEERAIPIEVVPSIEDAKGEKAETSPAAEAGAAKGADKPTQTK